MDVIEVLDKHLVGFYLRQNVEGPLTIGEDNIKPRREVFGFPFEPFVGVDSSSPFCGSIATAPPVCWRTCVSSWVRTC